MLVSTGAKRSRWRARQASLLPGRGSPLCHLCNRCGGYQRVGVAAAGLGGDRLADEEFVVREFVVGT